MSPYLHLRSRGFQEGPTGPVVYRSSIIVPLIADQREYNPEEKSTVERNIAVGLWVADPGSQVTEAYTQAAAAVFNSAWLNLRVAETDVVRKVYFHQIKKCNDQGRPFYLHLPAGINLSESQIEVANNSAIAADTVLEFQVDYLKIK